MNPNDRLQQLLALKRLEQPPPGFFDRLPGRIIGRIQAGQVAEETTWWRRLLNVVAARPALASACALVAGAFMIARLGLTTPSSELGPVVLGQSLAGPMSPVQPSQLWDAASAVHLVRYAESSFEPAVSVVSSADLSFGRRPIVVRTVSLSHP